MDPIYIVHLSNGPDIVHLTNEYDSSSYQWGPDSYSPSYQWTDSVILLHLIECRVQKSSFSLHFTGNCYTSPITDTNPWIETSYLVPSQQNSLYPQRWQRISCVNIAIWIAENSSLLLITGPTLACEINLHSLYTDLFWRPYILIRLLWYNKFQCVFIRKWRPLNVIASPISFSILL